MKTQTTLTLEECLGVTSLQDMLENFWMNYEPGDGDGDYVKEEVAEKLKKELSGNFEKLGTEAAQSLEAFIDNNAKRFGDWVAGDLDQADAEAEHANAASVWIDRFFENSPQGVTFEAVLLDGKGGWQYTDTMEANGVLVSADTEALKKRLTEKDCEGDFMDNALEWDALEVCRERLDGEGDLDDEELTAELEDCLCDLAQEVASEHGELDEPYYGWGSGYGANSGLAVEDTNAFSHALEECQEEAERIGVVEAFANNVLEALPENMRASGEVLKVEALRQK